MRALWTPVSWGCLGNLAVKRRRESVSIPECSSTLGLREMEIPWGYDQGSQVTDKNKPHLPM